MYNSTEGYKVVPQKKVLQGSRQGRLLRFLFQPPSLKPLPVPRPTARVLNLFARRLAQHPPDLVTHLGMVRSTAYYATGCPLELCDHAAARDLWQVIHHDVIGDGAINGGDRHGA